MKNLHQDSGDFERYTKEYITNAATDTFGGFIDLDPASCEGANETIRAIKFFTQKDDALTKDWFGNVWLNHPFSRANNPVWLEYAFKQFEENPRVTSLINITFSSTSSNWWQRHAKRSSAICYPEKRSVYKKKPTDKSGAMKDSSIFYFGRDPEAFKQNFEEKHKIGVVKIG